MNIGCVFTAERITLGYDLLWSEGQVSSLSLGSNLNSTLGGDYSGYFLKEARIWNSALTHG